MPWRSPEVQLPAELWPASTPDFGTAYDVYLLDVLWAPCPGLAAELKSPNFREASRRVCYLVFALLGLSACNREPADRLSGGLSLRRSSQQSDVCDPSSCCSGPEEQRTKPSFYLQGARRRVCRVALKPLPASCAFSTSQRLSAWAKFVLLPSRTAAGCSPTS